MPLYVDFKVAEVETFAGKERELAKPASFCRKTESQSLRIMLIDEQRQLKMEITYTIFAGLGTIARNQRITNLGAEKNNFLR